MSYITIESVLVTVLLFLPIVLSNQRIPANKFRLDTWFNRHVGPLSARKGSLDPELVAAENNVTVVKVNPNGGGDFETINDAVKSIPTDNKNRVIISIAPGTYNEKIKIGRYQPFITFYGTDPNDMPIIVYGGNAAKYGTSESGTLSVESDYFTAVNIIVKNCSPRPDGKMVNAQAVAMRIGGQKSSFYNCRFLGFQDTLLDDVGKHFYKDCYVEGTVDFIFGSAKSLYLNTEIHIIPVDGEAVIAAHARSKPYEDSGYSFVHTTITGKGRRVAYLGRSWFPYGRVVYSYSQLSHVVKPHGWSNNGNSTVNSTLFFGEYNNRGPGANLNNRVSYVKRLSNAEAKQFISLDYIEASKWLLPPHQL